MGGILLHLLKQPPLLGYILAGIIGGAFFSREAINSFAELGVILLLFSIGLELSLEKITRFGKVAIFGSIMQLIAVTVCGALLLLLAGIPPMAAVILAFGFSVASTAIVMKVLEDRAELETVQGQIMMGWLLVQDLAVIPAVVLLEVFQNASAGSSVVPALIRSLGVVAVLIPLIYLIGRKVAPFLLHKVAATNNREILILSAICLALGISLFSSALGLPAAFGAFLAGIVISESQENHAVFAETRPLRDLFVILFFISLGFAVSPGIIVANIGLIAALSIAVLILKTVAIYIIASLFGYRGRIAFALSMGLSHVGEFSFLVFITAQKLGLITDEQTAIGSATALVTLVGSPLLVKYTPFIWGKVKGLSIFAHGHAPRMSKYEDIHDHIIICGYGRVGQWVAKALSAVEIPFVIVEFNSKRVKEAKKHGMNVIFGDSSEMTVLDAARLQDAKAVVVAIPDRASQEEIIEYAKSKEPHVKVIVRAHLDEDLKKLTNMEVQKVIQPEFEGALAIVKHILLETGKSREEVNRKIRGLRRSHTIQ